MSWAETIGRKAFLRDGGAKTLCTWCSDGEIYNGRTAQFEAEGTGDEPVHNRVGDG